jgi:hypothetical protein
MRERHCSVPREKKRRDGLADDIAATDDDGTCSFDFDAAFLEEPDASARRTGDQTSRTGPERADVHGVKAVHVLLRVDELEDRTGRELPRERQLHEDAVHVIASIELVDETEQRVESDGFRQAMNLAVKASFLGGLFLVPDVDDAGLVLPGENDVEARRAAVTLPELRRTLGRSGPNLLRDLLAVEYRRHVAGVAERRGREKAVARRGENAQFTTTVLKDTAPTAARRSTEVGLVPPGFTY